jgi:hypothetical protein
VRNSAWIVAELNPDGLLPVEPMQPTLRILSMG